MLVQLIQGINCIDLKVRNDANIGSVTATNVNVSGILTATSHKLDSSSGEILTGIITATNIVVGTASFNI